jgi:hypothetical protein
MKPHTFGVAFDVALVFAAAFEFVGAAFRRAPSKLPLHLPLNS